MSAPDKNQNARKWPEGTVLSRIHLEIPRAEKTRATAAAVKRGQNLSDFTREALQLHCSRKRPSK